MKAKDFENAYIKFLDGITEPVNSTIYFRRDFYECNYLGYNFTKEELDKAEISKTKFIGIRNGIECYLEI